MLPRHGAHGGHRAPHSPGGGGGRSSPWAGWVMLPQPPQTPPPPAQRAGSAKYPLLGKDNTKPAAFQALLHLEGKEKKRVFTPCFGGGSSPAPLSHPMGGTERPPPSPEGTLVPSPPIPLPDPYLARLCHSSRYFFAAAFLPRVVPCLCGVRDRAEHGDPPAQGARPCISPPFF